MEVNYAWCAGFFDGEGSTTVLKAKRDKYAYLRMSISQKDRTLLDKFKNIMGVGNVYKSNKREIHSLDIYKREDVDKTLELLWPYLSDIKKNQALKAKEFVQAHTNE